MYGEAAWCSVTPSDAKLCGRSAGAGVYSSPQPGASPGWCASRQPPTPRDTTAQTAATAVREVQSPSRGEAARPDHWPKAASQAEREPRHCCCGPKVGKRRRKLVRAAP